MQIERDEESDAAHQALSELAVVLQPRSSRTPAFTDCVQYEHQSKWRCVLFKFKYSSEKCKPPLLLWCPASPIVREESLTAAAAPSYAVKLSASSTPQSEGFHQRKLPLPQRPAEEPAEASTAGARMEDLQAV
eukprot:CAMPEP_0113235930 /NCGR_PEP_ID=MMETSP0008_2-20120614/3818_1 /TAXON_ID=97485 /ORGANISM="Prymnesium parvum" /LENGTH=132 /DNA_ID=CAMNT_0000082889 /DNA_START=1901 /DNA_END=2300 /DNA_ORIENTATION=+ /assembly_acc=CAM_ASM_000153